MTAHDDARQTKALQEIANGVRQLVKIQETLNTNFVSFIRDVRQFSKTLDVSIEDILDDLEEMEEGNRKEQQAQQEMNPEDFKLGPDGKAVPKDHCDHQQGD